MNSDVRAVRELARDETALAAWRELAARAAVPNPYFEPGCLVPAATHLAHGADIHLAIAHEGGRWFGCFPLRPQQRWRAVRRPVVTTQVRRMMYDGTPLIDLERGAEAWAALLGGLRLGATRQGPWPGVGVFEWISDGPVARELGSAARRGAVVHRVYHRWERPTFRRRPEGSPLGGHSSKTLYNWRRARKLLERELGGPVRLTDRTGDPGCLDTVLAIEAAGYKGRTGVATDCEPGERAWLGEMTDAFRREGRLHVHTLDVGDRPVATQLLFRAGDGLFLTKLAYDEGVSRYSPGILLFQDSTSRLLEETDASWIDTCTYENNQTLLRLYPDRRPLLSVVVAFGGAIDKTSLTAVSAARRLLGREKQPADHEECASVA